MAPTLLPLNIVTPSGSKSRAYAPPNASLADLRSILVKDAIIKSSTKFHVDGVVISGSAEVHMQWTEIIREIHICDGEAPSVYHEFNANLKVSDDSSQRQPYPSPSHTPAPKELAQIPSFVEKPVNHNAHDSVCEEDLKPDCEDSRDCEGSAESSPCASPTTCQNPCDPPKTCADEGPHRPCDQASSGEDCAQAEPCFAREDPAGIEACQEEEDGDQQECEPYSDRPYESPNVAEGHLENDEHEEGVSSCNDRAPTPTCEDGCSNSKFRPLRLSVDGSVLKGKVVFEKPQTPRDGIFTQSSTPSASGPRRTPSRPSSATKVGFSVGMEVQPQTEWYQSDEYCGYGLPVTEQFNKPTVIRSQSRFPAQDDERTVMMSDLQDTTQTRIPAGPRSRSDTVSGGGILDTTIGASVQAGGNVKAEVELSTGGGVKFGLGFASHSASMTMDSRLQVDESWRQRLDIVNTVKTVMQVGCTDRARFASAFGGLEIDADLFQLGTATVVSVSSETQKLTASINDSSDDGTSQVMSGVSDSSPCSSPSVSTISIGQNAAIIASDKQFTLSDCGELSVSSATSHTESDTSALAKVPLYRLYAPSLPDHFYTTNAAERDACTGYGYTLESTAAQVLASPSPEGSSIPFFRIYRNKEHFYTADVVEKQRVVGWAGTRDEGIAGYVYPDRRVGTVPLYRLYNPGSDDHFYTTSAPEKEVCIKSGQWNDEGVACYVYP